MTAAASSTLWSRVDSVLLAGVVLVASAVRVPRLGQPDQLVFDELYYATEACLRIYPGDGEVCGYREPLSREHPPLAPLLSSLGIRLLGHTPTGWRLASAVVGIATVVVLYLLGRWLSGSAVVATVAAGLLAVDLLHLAHARLAMLDVFVTGFALAAVLAAVLAQRRGGASWLVATGVLLGAAVACKWTGAFAVVPVGVVLAPRLAELLRAPRRPRGILRMATALLAVPTVVYVLSFAGVVQGALLTAPWSSGSWYRNFAGRHLDMLTTGADIQAGGNNYVAPSWSWFLLKRPTAYFFDDDGRYREILATASPAAWWLSVAATIAFVLWLRRSEQAIRRTHLVGISGLLAAYAPWLVLGLSRSYTFQFYVLPAVPFLYLAAAAAAAHLRRAVVGRVALAASAALVLGSAAFLFPVATALPLSPDQWRDRMLFDDCGPGAPAVPTPRREHAPGGWCWI